MTQKSEENRKWAEGTDRALLWNHQGGRCAYCLREMARPVGTYHGVKYPMGMATIDHVKPLRRRTSPLDLDKRRIQNKVLACWNCNLSKGLRQWEPKIPPPGEIRRADFSRVQA